MYKEEIREGKRRIICTAKKIKEDIPYILKPYFEICKCLEAIKEIEKNFNVDSYIDYESVKEDVLNECFENNNDDFWDVSSEIDMIVDYAEDWKEELIASRKKARGLEVQEKYIDVFYELQGKVDDFDFEKEDDLEKLLDDIIETLNNINI